MAGLARTRNVVVACVLIALGLVVLDTRAGVGGYLRGPSAAVLGPLESLFSAPVRALRGINSADLDALRAENDALRAQLGSAALSKLSKKQLSELAALAPTQGYRRIPAHVVAVSTAADLTRTVAISAGTRAGVVAGSAVISSSGLIGVVDSAGPASATVLLLSDSTAHALVRVVQSRQLGFLSGSGERSSCKLVLIDQLADLRDGQTLVTAGSRDGGPFPAGLRVGKIAAVTGSAADLSRAAIVTLAADETALDAVLVLTPEAGP
ncbi:MAG: rod shape-determining protein MreC [Candidatus Nanopelagicales bacterium]